MENAEIKNAIIDSVELSITEHEILSAWILLNYEASGQGFGGWVLYSPNQKGDIAGQFIYKCLEAAGARSWDQMKGKAVRVKADMSKVHAIGHITKNIWFCPAEDFKTN